jgi:hypothetical protein
MAASHSREAAEPKHPFGLTTLENNEHYAAIAPL